MKVQLVVVRGKPEGKVIPLVGTNFKIGRGETCHLRPNSEQVSREHAEFSITDDAVIVRDLGSRNGTLVNGKALTAECRLKDRDLVQVGPLTFAVSISDVPAPAAKAPAKAPAAKAAAPATSKAPASPDDVSGDEIDSWLFGESAGLAADQPTAVYGGDTITITAFKDASASPPSPAAALRQRRRIRAPARGRRGTGRRRGRDGRRPRRPRTMTTRRRRGRRRGRRGGRGRSPGRVPGRVQPLLRGQEGPTAAGQADRPREAAFKDTSDAAGDILRRLMERRRAAKNV